MSKRSDQIEDLYHRALTYSQSERSEFLNAACEGDEALRREVESLLACESEAERLLEAPALAVAARSLAKETHPPLEGQQIGSYTILSFLGAGGTGEVYRARDSKLKRDVAIKFLLRHFSDSDERVRRFKREAEVLAALNHQNVVAVYDIGQHEQTPFIVSELLDGQTLRAMLSQGSIPIEKVVDFAAQIAEGLAAAHDKGIFHRDLKPENIFVMSHGLVKILDFGLAKLSDGSSVSDDAGSTEAGPFVTGTGMVMGTIGYMSPEQARGQTVDHRTDGFNLGVILYEMLSGARPFQAKTPADSIHELLSGNVPPLDTGGRKIPAGLENILQQCLQSNPADRFQAARDVAFSLRALSGTRFVRPSRTAVATAAKPKRKARVGAVVLAAGALVALALGILYFASRSLEPARNPATVAQFQRVTGSGDIQLADISPDGKFVAYLRGIQGGETLWLRQLATGRDLQIASMGADDCPGIGFSPDGSYIYFVRQPPLSAAGNLYEVSSLGGAPRMVASNLNGEPAISPDGKRVAFVRSTLMSRGEDSIVLANLDGSSEKILKTYKSPGVLLSRVTWTPDGDAIAYPAEMSLLMLRTNGGTPSPLPRDGSGWIYVSDVARLPGSQELLVAGAKTSSTEISQIFRVPLNGATPLQITQGLLHYVGVRATADGKTLVAAQMQPFTSLELIPPGKDVQPRVLSSENLNEEGEFGLAWTPDGRLLYTSNSNGPADIWEVGLDGSNRHSITQNDRSSVPGYITVSPKGDFIVFDKSQSNQHQVWRINRDGTGLKQLTFGMQDFPSTISPDGQWIVYSSAPADKPFLNKIPSGGGVPVPVTDYYADKPAISPDGKWIAAFSATGPGQPVGLAIIPFAGGRPSRIFPLPSSANTGRPSQWSPDGRSIYFVDDEKGVRNIWAQPTAGGGAVAVTHFTSGYIHNFASSPNNGIALSRGDNRTDAVLITNFR